jgi:hypothetical protein
LFGQGLLNGRFEQPHVPGVGFEQDITAGDYGPDILEPQPRKDAAQRLIAHVGIQGADPAKQGNIFGHDLLPIPL